MIGNYIYKIDGAGVFILNIDSGNKFSIIDKWGLNTSSCYGTYLVNKNRLVLNSTNRLDPKYKIQITEKNANNNDSIYFQLINSSEQLIYIFLSDNRPVSYTHLDVYKRQPLRKRCK